MAWEHNWAVWVVLRAPIGAQDRAVLTVTERTLRAASSMQFSSTSDEFLLCKYRSQITAALCHSDRVFIGERESGRQVEKAPTESKRIRFGLPSQ